MAAGGGSSLCGCIIQRAVVGGGIVIGLVIILLQGCKSSSPVILRASAPLLISKMLPSVGSEQT